PPTGRRLARGESDGKSLVPGRLGSVPVSRRRGSDLRSPGRASKTSTGAISLEGKVRPELPMFAGFVGLGDRLVGAFLVKRAARPIEKPSVGSATPGRGV